MDSEQAWAALKKRIQSDSGLDCGQYKENFLCRRIQVRMRATGCSDYGAYARFLSRHPEEYAKLVSEMAVTVTEFFRDPDTFLALRDEIIPHILTEKIQSNLTGVRVWSVGCATGEEPYSLAICFSEAIHREKEFAGLNVKIYATDLDEESLGRAKRALYENVTPLPGMELERYFDEKTHGHHVKDSIRKMVKFERSDIMAPPKRRFLDLIVCRNVMIYLNKESQAGILNNFRDSLRDSGYLVLGRSEILLSRYVHDFTPVLRRERIYRKAREAVS